MESHGLGLGAMAFAALSIATLLWSGWWTDRRYARFDRIPGHYDFKGRATRLDPRRQMAWLLPVVFSVLIAGYGALFYLLPAELQNGDPSDGLLLVSLVLLATQALILWLLARWARSQPNKP